MVLQVGFFDENSYYIFEFVLVEIDKTKYVIRIDTKCSSLKAKNVFMYLFLNCTILFAQSDACQILLDSMKDKVGKHSIPNY